MTPEARYVLDLLLRFPARRLRSLDDIGFAVIDARAGGFTYRVSLATVKDLCRAQMLVYADGMYELTDQARRVPGSAPTANE